MITNSLFSDLDTGVKFKICKTLMNTCEAMSFGNKNVKQWKAENFGDIKLPRGILFWSDNERDAFRRNRVVQTRFSMILGDINSQRDSSRRAIRYEAHKFRQRSGKYFRHSESPARTDSFKDHNIISPSEFTRAFNLNKELDIGQSDKLQADADDNEETQFPKMTGIITRTRKPSVRFSITDTVLNNSVDCKSFDNKETTLESPKENTRHKKPEVDNKHSIKRSLSAINFRDFDTRLLRRQKSAATSPQANRIFHQSSESVEKLRDLTSSPRSDTFFVKSKAAFLLRQDLKHRAKLRKQGGSQKIVTINDYLVAERKNYVQSSGKIMDYIKRIDSEKLFKPIIHNKWTAEDIEKQA